MVSFKRASGFVAAALVAAFSSSIFAAPVYTELGNSGTQHVTTYAPILQFASGPVATPYGGAPTITAQPGGNWMINFTLNSNFFAAANNVGGGEKQSMLAKLDFEITFDAPIAMTATLHEAGFYSEVGAGDASIFGGMLITAVDTNQQIGSGQLGNNAVFNAATGTWSSDLTVTGFAQAHKTYRFSIDNDLIAFAPAAANLASATIAKKDFTIIVGPNIPEPASLSILAIGAMSLIARRRKV